MIDRFNKVATALMNLKITIHAEYGKDGLTELGLSYEIYDQFIHDTYQEHGLRPSSIHGFEITGVKISPKEKPNDNN